MFNLFKKKQQQQPEVAVMSGEFKYEPIPSPKLLGCLTHNPRVRSIWPEGWVGPNCRVTIKQK